MRPRDRGAKSLSYRIRMSELGMHFPPSDIPAPARRLFALSWLRHLPDVDYEPVPLLPFQPEVEPIDMSRCVSSEGWHVQQGKGLPGQESEAP